MDDDFPDYAELISQYEATEYDMISDLNRRDKGNDEGMSDRPRNAPSVDSDSDSDRESGAPDDDDSQSSYEVDSGGEDGDLYESFNKEDGGSESGAPDDDDSQSSYEVVNGDHASVASNLDLYESYTNEDGGTEPRPPDDDDSQSSYVVDDGDNDERSVASNLELYESYTNEDGGSVPKALDDDHSQNSYEDDGATSVANKEDGGSEPRPPDDDDSQISYEADNAEEMPGRPRNAPVDSDSDSGSEIGSESGALDDDHSQNSYKADNGNDDDATSVASNPDFYESDNKEDGGSKPRALDDDHSQISYEADNAEEMPGRPRNAPLDSDSGSEIGSESGALDDDHSQNSYKADNDNDDGATSVASNPDFYESDNKEDGGSEPRALDDDHSQISYEADNGDDDGVMSVFSNSDVYESDNQEGGDEDIDIGSFSNDSDGSNEYSSFASATEKSDSDSDSEEEYGRSGEIMSTGSRSSNGDSYVEYIQDDNGNSRTIMAVRPESFKSADSYETAYTGDFETVDASDYNKEIKNTASNSTDIQSSSHISDGSGNGDSYVEYIQDDNGNSRTIMAVQPDSFRSADSYETAYTGDFEAADASDYNKEIQNNASNSTDIQSSSDRSDGSGSTRSHDDSNDSYSGDDRDNSQDNDGSNSDDVMENIRDDSPRRHKISEPPLFNRRGRSGDGFQYPSISSGTFSDSSNDSGWQDSDGLSESESEDEPNRKPRQPAPKSPKRPLPSRKSPKRVDDIQSDDDDQDSKDDDDDQDSEEEFEDIDDDQDSEEEFEDEPPIKTIKKKKGRSRHSDPDDKYNDEFDDKFNDEPIHSKAKKKNKAKKENKGAGRTNLSSLVSSVDLELIASREKFVVNRENTVNMCQRKFAKWFIAISILVCIGAIILVTVYFVNPLKKADTPAPTSLTIAMPTATPVTVSGAVPSAVPTTVTNTTPSMQPSKSPTAEPTPVPPDKVVVATTFLALIPNGKLEGMIVEVLKEDLTYTFEILFPQLLIEVFESDDIIVRTRNLLRTLQQSEDNIAIRGSISIDILEVVCPEGDPASDLCVIVTTTVPIVNSSNDFTQEYALKLENAFSSAIVNSIDDGRVQEIDPDIELLLIEGGEPTGAPIASSDISMEPSLDNSRAQRPVLRGSMEPTIPSSFTSSPAEFDTMSPTASDTSNNQTASAVPSSENIFEDNSTLNPTSSNTVEGNSTSEDFPTASPDTPPCTDENDGCQDILESGECSRTKCAVWASENECVTNPTYMNVKCKKSCGICGDSGLPVTPTPNPLQEPCSDENDRCGEWALQNECNNNPTYMELNCKSACGICGCEDKNDDCSDLSLDMDECLQTKCELWVSEDECETNSKYMNVFCRKSCDRCGDAPDN